MPRFSNGSTGEEHLRTQSIPNLRNLICSLENEAIGKQSELQILVGSYYHDFIQSADAIANMASKSRQMDEKISKLWTHSQNLIGKTQDLLNCSEINRENPSKVIVGNPLQNSSIYPKRLVLNSAEVWSYLQNCDVYNASKIIHLSELLKYLSILKENTQVGNEKFNHNNIFDFIINEQFDAKIINLNSTMLRESSFAIILKETVIEDGYLILLDDNASPYLKAQSIACIGQLSNISRGNLLTLFLEKMNNKLGINNAKKANDQNFGKELVALVKVLKEVLLSVFYLFFKDFEIEYSDHNKHNNIKNNSTSLSFGQHKLLNSSNKVKHTGLVSVLLSQLMTEIGLALVMNKQLMQVDSSTAYCNDFAFDSLKSVTSFIQAEKAKTSQNELRKILDMWLSNIVKSISEKITLALSSMTSASEVSNLQQKLWLISTTFDNEHDNINITSASSNAYDYVSHISSAYSQADWVDACTDIWSNSSKYSPSFSHPTVSTVSTVSTATTLLWSLIFRGPFMSQVERLLQESCHGVLTRVKARIAHCLSRDGLYIDLKAASHSISFVQAPSSTTTVSSTVGTSSSSFDAEVLTVVIDRLSKVNSIRFYHSAESVRALLEYEMNDILGAIILSVQEGESQSSQALSRALFIQSSQLIARFLIFIREISKNLSTTLHDLTMYKSAANVDKIASVVSGLLFTGRLAWLMKIRGRFLEHALEAPAVSTDSVMMQAESLQEYDLSTEDQLMSAFEIADTNGDGVLTYTESLEAIQALAVSATELDDDLETSPLFSMLSPSLTPSVTFNEFALLCCNLLSYTDLRNSVQRLCLSLDHIISTAHFAWAARLVACLSQTLTFNLSQEMLGLPFKALWTEHIVPAVNLDGLDEEQEEERERVELPRGSTGSLLQFLFAINAAAASLLSVDTVQALLNSSGNSSGSIVCLSSFVKSTVYVLAFAEVVHVYSDFLERTNKSISSNEIEMEEVAVQCVFDLTVAKLACASTCVGNDDGMNSFLSCLDAWRSHIDPINAALLDPLIDSECRSFAMKTHVITSPDAHAFTGMKKKESSSSPAAAAAAVNMVSLVFSSSASPRFGLLPLPLSMSSSSISRNFLQQANAGRKSNAFPGSSGGDDISSNNNNTNSSGKSDTGGANGKNSNGGTSSNPVAKSSIKSSSLMGSFSSSISNIGNISNFLSAGVNSN